MGLNTRPAACSSTGKRLRRKTWYYRDGKYFYNKRAWDAEKSKAAEKAEAGGEAKAA